MTKPSTHEANAIVDQFRARCPHCGALPRRWTRQRILSAGRRWIAETGETPRFDDWNDTTRRPEWVPPASSVQERFGTWSAFVYALGGVPYVRWTRERVIEAIIAWQETHGSWPTSYQWLKAGPNHPCGALVARRFGGSFPAAIRQASLEQRKRGADKAIVPTSPLVRAVDAWVNEAPFEPAADGGAGTGRSRAMFAELAGFDATRLTRILAQAHTTRRVADRILDTADLAYLWHVDPDLQAVLEKDAA